MLDPDGVLSLLPHLSQKRRLPVPPLALHALLHRLVHGHYEVAMKHRWRRRVDYTIDGDGLEEGVACGSLRLDTREEVRASLGILIYVSP